METQIGSLIRGHAKVITTAKMLDDQMCVRDEFFECSNSSTFVKMCYAPST